MHVVEVARLPGILLHVRVWFHSSPHVPATALIVLHCGLQGSVMMKTRLPLPSAVADVAAQFIAQLLERHLSVVGFLLLRATAPGT